MATRGVSQSDFVKDLGLNSSTVSNWCNGVMFPRMDKIKMLAEYLNISMLDLMRDNSQEQEQKKERYYLNIIEPHLAGADLNEKDLEDICSFIDYVKTRKQQ
jgi:transcriptional regulator with XRE-family HTH domain